MDAMWLPGPLFPTLNSQAVHVWQAELTVSVERLVRYMGLLAEDERERAARFRFERHRNHYIAGRGMLRELLGRYLGQRPEDLVFSYSEYGKPKLTGSELRFNLAHSGELALFAFGLHDALGVDLEAERPLHDALAIARRFFSPAEREALASLPEDQQAAAFFRCWTRKEAFIKAVGEGLSHALDAFEVTLMPDEPAQLRAIDGSEEEARKWSLYALDLPQSYYGAIAVKSRTKQLRLWRVAA